MIKRVQTCRRPDGWYSDYTTLYQSISFEDDQSYYRAVTWMRDEFGRAGGRREKTPRWFHNPETLTIGIHHYVNAMRFLESEYGWKKAAIHFRGNAYLPEAREWCDQRGYVCSIKHGLIDICVPAEQDLLMARLRFSEHAVPEPVF